MSMTDQEVITNMVVLQDKIHSEEYYIGRYLAVLGKNNMSTASIDQREYTVAQLIVMCNDFWIELPDSMSIHREPFGLLCDICEQIFE